MADNSVPMATWFRGSAQGGQASPTGHLHDFGDGVYFTDQVSVAVFFADIRAKNSGKPDSARVQVARFDPRILGNVLDLRTDPRWPEFFVKSPGGIGLASYLHQTYAAEPLAQTFRTFLDWSGIDLGMYDAVIGPEMSHGGNQMCILHKNGQPTALTAKVMSMLEPVAVSKSEPPPALPPRSLFPGSDKLETQPAPKGNANQTTVRIIDPVKPTDLAKPSTPVLPYEFPKEQSTLESLFPNAVGKDPTTMGQRIKRGVSNGGVAAAIGQALGSMISWLGDLFIEWRIRDDYEINKRPIIERILAEGAGVLIIVRLQEWEQPDDNGNKVRVYCRMDVIAGRDRDDALAQWRKRLINKDPGYRNIEQYLWVPSDN